MNKEKEVNGFKQFNIFGGMNNEINLEDIRIRTELKPGDIGYVIYLHGHLYKKEYNYGIGFETYVAAGLAQFYQQYDPQKDQVWICEHENKVVGFLLFFLCTLWFRLFLHRRVQSLHKDHIQLT